jgi:hypothetical protein
MSGTRRVPLARRPAVQVSPRAIDLYAAMGRLHCTCPPPSPSRELCPGCHRWYDLHADLHSELRCRSLGMALRRPAGSETRGLHLHERNHRRHDGAARRGRPKARRNIGNRPARNRTDLKKAPPQHDRAARHGVSKPNAFGLPHRGPSSISHPSPPQMTQSAAIG